ncbi:PREDICTED: PCNA-associated factor-like isoform X2 [Papilio polytes]|uniref:PCNA-associated factor-like isoform X2 n=1 Tax=Papilio polytes TaxID=76194 RepID=UPI000675D9D6|nr:PREDICTED: PCNA-associated factor-like isoform X2 [Papilio polytes]
MARTKASVGAKVSSGKSSKARCCAAPPSNSIGASGGGDRSSRGLSGGNPVCPRETPIWQRPITNFIVTNKADSDSDTPRSSQQNNSTKDDEVENSKNMDSDEEIIKTKPKRNKILSDDEEEIPKNTELEESLVLEPLTGENSHKIDEYYQKNNKGKGKGKKTKENTDEIKRNLKRDLEDITFGEESEHSNKKAKIE